MIKVVIAHNETNNKNILYQPLDDFNLSFIHQPTIKNQHDVSERIKFIASVFCKIGIIRLWIEPVRMIKPGFSLWSMWLFCVAPEKNSCKPLDDDTEFYKCRNEVERS